MQMKYPEPACKYTAKIDNADRIPFFVEQAVRCKDTHAIW